MTIDSKRYAKILQYAAEHLHKVFSENFKEDMPKILEDEVQAEDYVAMWNALASSARIMAITARLGVNAKEKEEEEETLQALKEDCVVSKIFTKLLLEASFDKVLDNATGTQTKQFLEQVDFFQFPDEEIIKWGLNLSQ